MVGYIDTSDVDKKAAEAAQKQTSNWLMVSFIYNGSEITTWMENIFRIKCTKFKETFLR